MMPEESFNQEHADVNRLTLTGQSEREQVIEFLARESTEVPQWKSIYKYKLELYAISEAEVQAQAHLHRGLSKGPLWSRPEVLVAREEPIKETLIYCWPYHVEASAVSISNKGAKSIKEHKFTATETVIACFALTWLLGTLAIIGVKLYGMWWMFKGVPLMLLPFFGMMKGLTHIRINSRGLVLESAAGKTRLKATNIAWSDIGKAYVEMPENAKTPLSGKLVLNCRYDKQRKIPLKKIASGEQWRRLVTAMAQYIDVNDLDPALLDGLNQGTTRDPSYTKLWLDALTAPPRRERLQPLVPGIELQKGQYKIEKLLGSGGQGSAYLASFSTGNVVLKEYILPVYVDIKVRRQALEDFEHEAKILTSLNHRNIVKSTGSFIEDHRAYLVLEYIEGKSLRQLVEDSGPLPESDCVKYALEMCEILSYLHRQSPPVVHQDFAPDNLLVSPDGTLKLIDFMVAKQSAASDAASGQVVGKHHFMPPEQFRGKATTRSDIYALGCSLYFILTGCDPEPMSTSHPTLANRDVSGAMNVIVEKSTMLNQGERYQHAREIIEDLKSLAPHSDLSECNL